MGVSLGMIGNTTIHNPYANKRETETTTKQLA